MADAVISKEALRAADINQPSIRGVSGRGLKNRVEALERELSQLTSKLRSNTEKCERFSVMVKSGIDTDFELQHSLGKVPAGFRVVSRDNDVSVVKGVAAWTDTSVYLRADQEDVPFKVEVFV